MNLNIDLNFNLQRNRTRTQIVKWIGMTLNLIIVGCKEGLGLYFLLKIEDWAI